ncbi:MAG: hypothetical protein LBE24_05995 [Methylobacillus sp.]|jgi:hypothetical protein|nr:hypothetical protein [Methylobacillus sp.]
MGMPLSLRKIFFILTATLIISGQANAMQIMYQSLDEVLGEAETVFVAEIGSVAEPVKQGNFIHVDFDARPLKVLYGSVQSEAPLMLTYTQVMPHYREGKAVSPLVSGSGSEFDLKQGDHVIILLGTQDVHAKRWSVLRVEAMTQLEEIQRKLSDIHAEEQTNKNDQFAR